MPAITASIEYLADLDRYRTEKPWSGLLVNSQKRFFDKGQRLDNIELEYHNRTIRDAREHPELKLEKTGFAVHHHKSSSLSEFDTLELVEKYKVEMNDFLEKKLDTCFVKTYDCHTRLNVVRKVDQVDVLNELLVDSPAVGAHNDVTLKSGPEIVMRNFSTEELRKYLQPGYRIRVMNTWRPLHPVCEDKPLAFCDASSIVGDDLVAADRVYPQTIGEIYYLKFNADHRWYWIDSQTPEDVLVMTMYDSHPGGDARYCPHVPFDNSRAPEDAPPRRSVETRSIVVSKLKE